MLQHFRKSRESHIGGALDVRGAVASEVAVIDSLHQAQASGALQAGANTRDHVRFIGFPKEISPRSLASGLPLERTTTGLREVYIGRVRCNETLKRIVCALRLERYGRQMRSLADRSLT